MYRVVIFLRVAFVGLVYSWGSAPGAAGEGCYPNDAQCTTWRNWDLLQQCHPREYVAPTSEDEVILAVNDARKRQVGLKVVGAGHSFSAIALSYNHTENATMLSLDNMASVVRVEDRPDGQAGKWVTFQAGIRLHDLNTALEHEGLSIENLGATCEQSLAGATQTGTHGTGRLLGSMSTFITHIRLVDGMGNIRVLTATAASASDRAAFAAARVGLGALGVLVEITVQTVPLFKLRLTNTVVKLDTLLTQLPSLMPRYERLQWYWLPYDDAHAMLVTREVTTDPIEPAGQGCWGAAHAQYFLGEPIEFYTQSHTQQVTRNSLAAPLANTTCVDVSYKALCGSPAHYAARNLYTEMEMFIPMHDTVTAIRNFRDGAEAALKAHHNASVGLFTGVRYVRGDDITLSPQTGNRSNAVVSMIIMGSSTTQTGSPQEMQQYDTALETLTQDTYQGRPHWGKRNWATNEQIRKAYGDDAVDAFLAVRSAYDPAGLFMNDYLKQRLL